MPCLCLAHTEAQKEEIANKKPQRVKKYIHLLCILQISMRMYKTDLCRYRLEARATQNTGDCQTWTQKSLQVYGN